MTERKRTMWSRAAEMVAQALQTRNRYVDFLCALSILALVVGHWLVALPFVGAALIGFGPVRDLSKRVSGA